MKENTHLYAVENIHKWFLLALVVVVFQWQPLTSRGQCS